MKNERAHTSRGLLMAVLLLVTAMAVIGIKEEAGATKKGRSMGTIAIFTDDRLLFSDTIGPPKKWTPPAGYSPDPIGGSKIFSTMALGNCAACHCAPNVTGCGDVGPSLAGYKKGVGAGKSFQEVFAIIADPRTVNPDTVMPPAAPNMLTPKQVADVAAYVMGLPQ